MKYLCTTQRTHFPDLGWIQKCVKGWSFSMNFTDLMLPTFLWLNQQSNMLHIGSTLVIPFLITPANWLHTHSGLMNHCAPHWNSTSVALCGGVSIPPSKHISHLMITVLRIFSFPCHMALLKYTTQKQHADLSQCWQAHCETVSTNILPAPCSNKWLTAQPFVYT